MNAPFLTRQVLVTLAVTALALLASSPLSASPCQAVQRVDAPWLESVMISMGIDVKEYPGSPNGIAWGINNSYVGIFYLYNDGGTVLFYRDFQGSKATEQDVHDWTVKHRARSFINDKGVPVLETELDLAGGVCVRRVVEFIKSCQGLQTQWANDLGKKVVTPKKTRTAASKKKRAAAPKRKRRR
ncbi:MAG: YbjN domain-containing protein [Deltaproteobacteria bacterium]|nr:YbjN domain-containing protein [Deltaproteobacteria bacterium]